MGDKEVQLTRLGDERPGAIDQAPDHRRDGEGDGGARHRGEGSPAPIPPPRAPCPEEDHGEGRREQHLGAVDVEDERVLDGIVLAQEVVESVEDRPFHTRRSFTPLLQGT